MPTLSNELDEILNPLRSLRGLTTEESTILKEADFNKAKEQILELFATQNTALLDSLIDEEVKLYNIYKDPVISVGIKIMADKVREKYDDRTSE